MGVSFNGFSSLTNDDVTDNRYKLEDRKRKIAQAIDNATKNKRLQNAKEHYYETKTKCERLLDESGNDHERKVFNDIVAAEPVFMTTNSPIKIQEKSDELHSIISKINWRTPDVLKDWFNWLKGQQQKMNDQTQAKSQIDAGRFAIESQNWDRLRDINYSLLDLLPRNVREEGKTKIGFGL